MEVASREERMGRFGTVKNMGLKCHLAYFWLVTELMYELKEKSILNILCSVILNNSPLPSTFHISFVSPITIPRDSKIKII